MAFIKQTFVDGVTVVQAAWLNGIQEVVGAGAVAPEYNPEQTYAVGTLVSHDAQLYICTTTIASPEAWNSSHWMATSLQALVSEQKGVYWCVYGVSTYAQVDNAKSKSMLPICTYDFTVDNIRYRGTAVYAYISGGSYVFFDCCETGTFLKLYINSESTWTRELLNPLVPVGRTVNGKALSTNIALDAEDIQYDSSLVSHEAGSIGYELNSLNEKDAELDNEVKKRKVFWTTIDNIQQADAAFNDGCYLLTEYNFTQDGTTFKGVATYSYKITSSSSVYYYFFDYDGRYRIQVSYGYGNNITMELHEAIDTVDSQMSDSSERAVQNKVIKAYVDSVVAYGMNIVDVSGTTPTIDAQAETRYVCGEVTSLTISSLPQRGIADIMFTSGSTPTVLTLPNTVIMPAWFDATSLDANTTYEINIMDGVYGTVMQWA